MQNENKNILVARIRRLFFVSNIVGLTLLTICTVMCFVMALNNPDPIKSPLLWLSLVLFFMIPFAIIHLLSAITLIEIKNTSLVLTFLFKGRRQVIKYTDIRKTTIKGKPSKISLNDSLLIELIDGRRFEIHRSHFDTFDRIRSHIERKVR